MSVADTCLVRMAEQVPSSSVFNFGCGFHVRVEPDHLLRIAAERRYNTSHGRKPVDCGFQGFPAPWSGTEAKLCRPYGACAEWKFKSTGLRPWLRLYRRYAAKQRQQSSGW